MGKLWVVSLEAQESNVKHFCFDECGNILIGGLDIMGGIFMPCKTEACEYTEKSMDLGEFDLPEEGKMGIVVRKLMEVPDDRRT
jgi:hypothetical protein